jgi:general secretion pathway protein J
VVLIRSPFRISFAYAGADQVWQKQWRGQKQLPDAIRISVRDIASGQVLAVSGAAIVHVNAAAACARAKNPVQCLAEPLKPDSEKDRKEEQL